MSTENEKGIRHKGNTTIFYITGNGLELAKRVSEIFREAEIVRYKSGEFEKRWHNTKNIICIMATGIVVRAAAPLIKDKKSDPAVVVLDEKGRFAISLLSGHLGGANELAKKAADYLGGEAVITTASDVQGKLAIDLWARDKGLFVEDFEKLKRISAKIVNGKKIKLKTDDSVSVSSLPEEFIPVDSTEEADVIVSHRLIKSDALFLRPKNLFAGVGCNRGTSKEEIGGAVKDILQEEGLSCHSVRNLATIDVKMEEGGLLAFAHDERLDIDFFSREELNKAALSHNIRTSKAVRTATGAVAVAEPAALLSAQKLSNDCTLLMPKRKKGNVTLAIAAAKSTL